MSKATYQRMPDGSLAIMDHPYDSTGDANSPCHNCGEALLDHHDVSMVWVKRQEWNGPIEKENT